MPLNLRKLLPKSKSIADALGLSSSKSPLEEFPSKATLQECHLSYIEQALSRHLARTPDSPVPRQTSRFACFSCKCTCTDQVVHLGTRVYHLNCFTCSICGESLALKGYFERDSRLFCPQDYQELFGERCGSCNDFIDGPVRSALGLTFHEDCFVCSICSAPLPPNSRVFTTPWGVLACASCCGFSVADGGVDVPLSITVVCAACCGDVTDADAILALDRLWHPWCFRCTICRQILSGTFYAQDDKAFCPTHRPLSISHPICYSCNHPIIDDVSQLADGISFHPQCVICSYCYTLIENGQAAKFYPTRGGKVFHLACDPSSRNLSTDSLSGQGPGLGNGQLPPSSPVVGGTDDESTATHNQASFYRSGRLPRSVTFSSTGDYTVKRSVPTTFTIRSASLLNRLYMDPKEMSNDKGSSPPPYRRFLKRSYGEELRSAPPSFHHASKTRAPPILLNLIDRHNLSVLGTTTGSDITATPRARPLPTYPRSQLYTFNPTFPPDVDRARLEQHLTPSEFFATFKMAKCDFYALPYWKQVVLKKLNNLF